MNKTSGRLSESITKGTTKVSKSGAVAKYSDHALHAVVSDWDVAAASITSQAKWGNSRLWRDETPATDEWEEIKPARGHTPVDVVPKEITKAMEKLPLRTQSSKAFVSHKPVVSVPTITKRGVAYLSKGVAGDTLGGLFDDDTVN
jgi:hypothetical protein